MTRSPYFILLIAVVAANWQLVFLQSGMNWDMMNFWLPWRYYMSECYNNGIVPLWDPYTQSGYPVHGDLQGPAYSPEAMLVSFLFGQNIYVLNYCFVFYLFVAAVGMYKLTHFFTGKKEVSVLAGIIYSLSGFNIAHGHYFYIIVSVALVPLLFYYFFRILKRGTHLDALKMALVIFWHVTTGNPSFLIISGYLMVVVFIAFLFYKIRNKQSPELLAVLANFIWVGVLSALMALPVIYNAMQVVPLTTRKNGLDLAYAGEESFYFENFIAFMAPLITITDADLAGDPQQLWSPYIGVFAVFLFVLGLFSRKDFFERVLLFIGIAGLLIALGIQWPIYPFLHKYVPFFNIFRMPNLSLIFFLVAVIILAAKYLADEQRVEKLFSKKIIWYLSAVWLVVLVWMYYIARKHQQENIGLFENYTGLREWLYAAKPEQIMLFHTLMFIVTLLVLLLARFAIKNKLRALAVAILFDMFVNYQLGGVARNFSPEKAADMNEYFARFPKGFAPPANMAMERVSPACAGWPGYWLNTSIFIKQPDYPNSNNFELTNYLDLLLNRPKLSKNIFKNSYAFFADSLMAEENFTDSIFASAKSCITLGNADLEKIKANRFSNGDNLFFATQFLPNKMSYMIDNKTPTAFVICQNYCPLWRFTLNGQPFRPVASCRGSFPVFLLPAGKWEIQAAYDLPGYGGILFLSLSLFVIILWYVVLRSMNPGWQKRTTLMIIPLLFTYCVIKFWSANRAKEIEGTRSACEGIVNKKMNCSINNTSLDIPGTLKMDLVRSEDLRLLSDALDAAMKRHLPECIVKLDPVMDSAGQELQFIQYDRYFPAEAEKLITLAYGHKQETTEAGDARMTTFRRRSENKIVTDTLLWPENNRIDKRNPYSIGISFDSIPASRYKPGDLFYVTADIGAQCFDFPGIAFEVHYADGKGDVFKYANISQIKKSGIGKPALVYQLPATATHIKKIALYVWNPSLCEAQVSRLEMRVYRP